MYTSVCFLVTVVFSRERCLIQTVSGRFRRPARVHRFPYDAYRALDRGGDHYHEFCDIYIGTIAPHLEMLMAHALTDRQLTKKTAAREVADQVSERRSLASPVGDDSREAR